MLSLKDVVFLSMNVTIEDLENMSYVVLLPVIALLRISSPGNTGTVSQMAPYSLYSPHRALIKRSALCRD